ncbi:GTP-binding protein gtr1, partial [Fusarium sp. DS 682]
MRDAKSYGFSVEQSAPFDWGTFKKKRDAIIKNLNDIHERNLKNDGVEYIHGRACLVGKNESMIKLHDDTEIKVNAKKILLATGGHPTVPQGIPGAEHGINSDGFFELEHQPKKVALVGAG